MFFGWDMMEQLTTTQIIKQIWSILSACWCLVSSSYTILGWFIVAYWLRLHLYSTSPFLIRFHCWTLNSHQYRQSDSLWMCWNERTGVDEPKCCWSTRCNLGSLGKKPEDAESTPWGRHLDGVALFHGTRRIWCWKSNIRQCKHI